MRDDLISRKEALEILFKDGEWICDVSRSYERIKNLPTAYDVEAVYKEIEKMKKTMLSPVTVDCFGEPCRESDCLACVLNRAAEIVRNGGKK